MEEFIENTASEHGQLAIARAILSLDGSEYSEEKVIREFNENPPSEYGQKAIANAIRFLGGEQVPVYTKEKEFVSTPASANGQKEIVNAIRSVVGKVGPGGGGGTPVLEDKTVKSTDVEQIVTAGEGYDGIRNVTVSPIVLQKKTVTLGSTQQVISADNGYDYLDEVTVPAVNLQNKTVTPSNAQQIVTADSGYAGLGQVTVGPDSGTDTLAQAFTTAGVAEYTVNGTSPQTVPKIVKLNLPDIVTINKTIMKENPVIQEVNLPAVTTFSNMGFESCFSLKKMSMPSLTTITVSPYTTLMSNLPELLEISPQLPVITIPTNYNGSGVLVTVGKKDTNNKIDIELSMSSQPRFQVLDGCNFRNVTISTITSLSPSTGRLISVGSIKNLYFPDLETTGNGNYQGLFTSLEISGGIFAPKLTTLGNFGFYGFNFSSPANLEFPLLETIGNNAFYTIRYLKSIKLPKVTSISASAFASCSELTDIYLGGSTVASLSNVSAFSATGITASSGSIHVPAELEQAYKEATNWSTFASRIVGDYTE